MPEAQVSFASSAQALVCKVKRVPFFDKAPDENNSTEREIDSMALTPGMTRDALLHAVRECVGSDINTLHSRNQHNPVSRAEYTISIVGAEGDVRANTIIALPDIDYMRNVENRRGFCANLARQLVGDGEGRVGLLDKFLPAAGTAAAPAPCALEKP